MSQKEIVFNGVQELKEWSYQEDKYRIYEIDPNQQHVFKSSKMRMKLAKYVYLQSAHYMKNEICLIDGRHGRTNEFKTPTASKYHPLLMYYKHEDTRYGKGFAVFSIMHIKKRTWRRRNSTQWVGVATWLVQILIGLKRFTEKM